MKKAILFLTLLSALQARSQSIINSWSMNVNGKTASQWGNNGGMPPSWTFVSMTDSADVLQVCYNADTVWVRSKDLTDNMGKWLNPGNAVAYNTVHRFPRTPIAATTKVISPKGGEIGMLTNGILIYGLGDAYSWNGSTNTQMGGANIWNREVGLGEGMSLDTAFGAHPQAQGTYHSHTTPYRLYRNVATTTHSPLVGWAFDGYPIYGPYGYTNAMDAGSGVSRMRSGYSLRNITTRTTYAAIPGGGGNTPQAGPPVSSTYPIGTYCEDYEWLSSNGDLDEHNGRLCVTPEFPNGTYAYFVTVDAVGKAVFPYYVGIYYYGKPDTKNFPSGPQGGNGLSVPAYLGSCRVAGSNVGIGSGPANGNARLEVYPNPAQDGTVYIKGNDHRFTRVMVMNMSGQVVYTAAINGKTAHRISLPAAGLYLIRCDDGRGGIAEVQRVWNN